MARRPTDPQYCEFCDQVAVRSLIWADGRTYTAVCNQDTQRGRNKIHAFNSAVSDVKEIDGQRTENFGHRAVGKRADSAGTPPPPAALEAVSKKAKVDTDKSFLAALGKDWTVLRARKINPDRLDVTLDGEKYTIYTRKG